MDVCACSFLCVFIEELTMWEVGMEKNREIKSQRTWGLGLLT